MLRIHSSAFALPFALLSGILLGGCGGPGTHDASQSLVIYSGRSESLVQPIVDRFQEATGIDVMVRYGDTAQLAVALAEEGVQTEADLYWAQDAGALSSVHEEGMLAPLPDSLLTRVPRHFRNGRGTWIATSGRARVLAYSSKRTTEADRPGSLFDLAEPRYAGRTGWAPANGSFQAHVTAIRAIVGDDSTKAWLTAMQNHGAKSYANNRSIVQAIADGEIDWGLPNHYYLYRFRSEDPAFPVEQTFFDPGDPGNLVNVAGIAILAQSDGNDAAARLIDFLLSIESQEYFSQETYEYPVIDGVDVSTDLPSVDHLDAMVPPVHLDALGDLEGTLELLRDAGLL